MDIRIEKTDRAIEKAFMELRARQPLEKIRIKDLCTLAKVNKSTFYAHYEDIYELSSRLENKLIHVILVQVSFWIHLNSFIHSSLKVLSL